MSTTRKRKTIAALFASIALVAAAPALAQVDATRIEEMEAKTANLVVELAALRTELDEAKKAGSGPNETR